MESIGQYLRTQRIAKKISLQKISKELKISYSILQNIESDKFPDYIDKVFLVGHIKSYSNYLELDQKSIIEKFKIQILFNQKSENFEISKPAKINDIFIFSKSISFAGIFLISVSFFYLFVNSNNLDKNYAMIPDVPENLSSELEKIQMDINLENLINN